MRTLVIGCFSVLTSSLLLARVHPFGDAGLYQRRVGVKSVAEQAGIPPGVRETLAAKCADCHSMQARTPVYGRFAPVSWLMERDIVEAREKLNLSRWDDYSPEERETFRAQILQQTTKGKMPLAQYRLIHWGSRITDTEQEGLLAWAKADQGAGQQTAPSEGDPERGRAVFQSRCIGCHSLERSREGPALGGVFGRKAGSVPGFEYSAPLKSSGIVWDEVSLEKWLTDPDALVPGNNMDFHVPRAQERADLVRFFREGSK
ncbi:heme-binding domain-containing protein [Granulicella sibirica]|uniref:heme-binding domain-containing protein n=1 Tax=Granulicella sibirica TaxID=2479048 RepID=UPI001F4FA5E2|nr:heme-binding domain-containing protein [Granulicella sibirica]